MKIWIATYVDEAETADGKARVLDVCKTKEEALEAVRNDIEEWADKLAGAAVEVDFDKMRARHTVGSGESCEWNVEEHELDIDKLAAPAPANDDKQLEFAFNS